MSRVHRALLAAALIAAGSPGLSAAEGGGGSALISPNLGTIFWTIVTFIIFAFVLSRVAWKPLIGALDARETSIRESIEGAQNDREEAAKMLTEQRQLVAAAHRERAAGRAVAREEAERLKAEILEEARKQREQILAQANAQMQAAVRQAKSELRVEVVDLAILAAGKLLDKNLDDESQRRLVERHLSDLEGPTGAGTQPS